MKASKLLGLLVLILIVTFLATCEEKKVVAQFGDADSSPLPETSCDVLRDTLDRLFKVGVTMAETSVEDVALGLSTIECQLTLLRESLDDKDHLTLADDLKAALVAQAWQEDPTYIAYGPNQITLAFINGNNSGILEVGWRPATEADCVAHRSAAVCQVKANHRIYTVTFTDISTLDLLDNGSSS